MLAEIGYAVSALGYLLLFLLFLTVRKTGLPKKLLIAGVLVNLVASIFYAVHQWFPSSLPSMMLLESSKSLIWLIFIASCLKGSHNSLLSMLKQPVNLVIISLPLLAIGAANIPLLFADEYKQWQFLLHTIINLEILVLLETFYRQADQEKWAYKPLVIALGGVALFNFVMFSEASMITNIDPLLWEARGYIYAILIPFLVIAIRRIKIWGIDIFVSREVVLHSSLLVVAGGYLFVMALAGYAIKLIGGNWSHVIQIVFVFLSLTLMVALFLSNQFRTKIKVFITKHFFANQFDYREEWLKLTQILDNHEGQTDDHYYTATLSLVNSINCRAGLLLRLNQQELQCVANVDHDNLNNVDAELLQQLLPFIRERQWIIDIAQLRARPFDYEGVKVNHALLNGCSFHLILPIFKQDELWGLALVQDEEGQRQSLNWELRDYLKVVTTQVASFIFQHEASKELAENAQFAAFSRMSAFVLHDLKNVLAQIDLILCNAEQHKHNPEFIEDTFETLVHTKARMEKMLKQLSDKKDVTSDHIRHFSIAALLQEVVEKRCMTSQPIPQLQTEQDCELKQDADKLGNVLYHLINNAQQATENNGEIIIATQVHADNNVVEISIEDNGCGMSGEFIQDRLFKPFDTTKGNAGMGIGAYDAKSYVEKIGGQLSVCSKVGEGSRFTLFIPTGMY
ncbi:PEP-CTERM system histidine kinase PrsK [Alteromonadaceae bacterium BrNp21-10]|nr:PEP-CTERM system histidine kinase PrsK [Alteromonadaceae bacterium BrNp21-10]